jgi:hypothetical protein
MRSLTQIIPIVVMAVVTVLALTGHVAVAVEVVTINMTNTGLGDYTLLPLNNTTVLLYYTPVTFGVSPSLEGYYISNCQFTQAPTPQAVNTVEPELAMLPNGTIALMWLRVYGRFPNVTVVLQEAVWHDGHWGSPINITHSGVVLSYTSDGEYIYIDYEPTPGLNYPGTRILVTTMSGVVVKTYNIPDVVTINAYDMSGVLLLDNGSMAFINLRNGAIEPISQSLVAGVTSNGVYYTYNPQSHALTIGSTSVTIPGNYSGAYPIPFNNGYIIVAWGNVVSAFKWVGGSLTPIANLTGMGNWGYLEADGVVTGTTAVIAFLNTYNMRLYVSIVPLNGASCTPGLKGAVTTTTTAPVVATATTTVTVTKTVSNATTVTRTATVYVNTTVTVPVSKTVTATVVRYLTTTVRAPASGVPIVIVVVIVAVVAIVVFLVTRRHYSW